MIMNADLLLSTNFKKGVSCKFVNFLFYVNFGLGGPISLFLFMYREIAVIWSHKINH